MTGMPGVLVIGAGEMGAMHARHWRDVGGRVVAVCDPDPDRARTAAEAVDAFACDDPGPMLERDDVHVVSICTPTHLHAHYAVAALGAGKHVLCEKPVALTLGDAERMKEAAERSEALLRVGFMRRFDPAFAHLLEAHATLGDPVLAQATISAGMRPKSLMHDADANGGPIIDMCCHLFDLWARLYGGLPQRVSARGHTFCADRPELDGVLHKALDSALLTLEYASGAVAQVQVSWGLPSGISPMERHTYMGPAGLLTFDWNRGARLQSGSGDSEWAHPGGDPWRTQIEEFACELQGVRPRRLADVDDGIAALRTSLAVLESVRSGEAVFLRDAADAPLAGGPPTARSEAWQ